MENSKHTKGEWKVSNIAPQYQLAIGTDKYTIAYTTLDLEKTGVGLANAKLMAASKDLLEALIDLKAKVNLDLIPESTANLITNAIDKATK
jgi:hypothetical protein